MSTEYERSVHPDNSAEEQSSSWRDREHAESGWVATESEPTSRADVTESDEPTAADVTGPAKSEVVEHDGESRTPDHDAGRAEERDGTPLGSTTDDSSRTDGTPTDDGMPDQMSAESHDIEADTATTPTDEPDPSAAVLVAGEPAGATDSAAPQRVSLDDVGNPLFTAADVDQLRIQWREVQGAFVDNPRDAVTQADKIVSDIIYQLTTTLAERKRTLEEHCSGVGDADTEELRQAIRGYRGFFHRLLVVES
ncbi:hypothetical protein [Nocardia altamirensis]|uniref:hypothetical protein n=1 Tax=Nocardia altamirensis TaxID=472158 RepID=UPI0008400DD2|nr:hypothetical protein [Nocardia altamirensis]